MLLIGEGGVVMNVLMWNEDFAQYVSFCCVRFSLSFPGVDDDELQEL